ncbi:MAG: bifunctional folylpolyglutamate synthase/dihydrofolate synthase, partial [Dehalococcoidia bacterium]|nr:bifunctional folylpolyglutamate synthase/dihydrofolate synthase [Dehalococcoidia bacterium]
MNYRQAEDYILSFTDYEKIPGIAYTSANYDLRRMEKLLLPLGNPHLETRTVHIAG